MPSVVPISIIILNWNNWPDTKRCLASLHEDSFTHRCQLILVENGSHKHPIPPDFSDSFFYETIVIRQENQGFTGGNNVGAQKARGKYLLLLNDDTLVPTGTLEACFSYLEHHPQCAAAGPTILNPDGSVQSAGLTTDLWTATTRRSNQPLSLSGSCLFIRHDIWKKLGGFNPDYFAYFEETELCLRIRKAGYAVALIPGTSIIHKGGSHFSPFAETLYARNRWYLVRDHGSLLQRIVFFIYMLLIYTPSKLVLAQRKNRAAYWKGFRAGLRSFFTNRATPIS